MRKIIFGLVFVIAIFLSSPIVANACINWGTPVCVKRSLVDNSCLEWNTPCLDGGSQNCGAGYYACSSGCCPIDPGGGSGTHGTCSCGVNASGACKSCGGCTPNCSGKSCGDDGCGGGCGVCPSGFMCSNFSCICAPNCNGRLCGSNTCNTASCGTCPSGYACTNYQCVCTPVDGGWSAWSAWGACVGCNQTRTRTCTNPAPNTCGAACVGSATESQVCGVVAGGWSAWGACTVACGGGTQTRTCTNPSPVCGGATCVGSNTQACNTQCCPVNGAWSAWSPLTCTTLCGQSLTRTCTNPAPSCSGLACAGSATFVCANTDAGAPAVPVVSTPNTVVPKLKNTAVIFRWSAVAGADDYQISVLNSIGTTVWTTMSAGATQVTNNSGFATPGTYTWRVRSLNDTCATEYSAWSTAGSFVINTAPVYTSLTMKNSAGVTVPWDTNRNQICKPAFQNNNIATFEFLLTDANGGADITSASMRWNGVVTPLTLSSVAGNNVLASATINYSAGPYVTADQPVYVQYNDAVGEGTGATFTLSTYSWKVWNCTVPLTGNMFDSSNVAIVSCLDPAGFTVPVTGDANFTSVDVRRITPSSVTNVLSTPPDSYSANSLIKWGDEYRISPNVDLAGGNPVTRWVGTGGTVTGCNSQNTVDATIVDPYAAAPALKVDFSTVVSQEPWYSTSGGGIQASTQITNLVPITCSVNSSCVAAMSSGLTVGEPNSSLVAGSSINNNSGCSLGSQCHYGSPNDWHIIGNVLSSNDKYSYDYFYDKYFQTLGQGVTTAGNSTMTYVNSIGGTGVILVNGTFTVDANNTLSAGQFLMIIAKNGITFSPTVKNSAGIFLSGANIVATGASNDQLIIEGSLYAASSGTDIQLTRGFNDKSANNLTPAVLVKYRPDLIFNIPGEMLKVMAAWRQG